MIKSIENTRLRQRSVCHTYFSKPLSETRLDTPRDPPQGPRSPVSVLAGHGGATRSSTPQGCPPRGCSASAHLSYNPTTPWNWLNRREIAARPFTAPFTGAPPPPGRARPPQFPSVYPCMRPSRRLTCRRSARPPRPAIGRRGWQSRPAPARPFPSAGTSEGPLRAAAPTRPRLPLPAGRAAAERLLPEQDEALG